MPLSITYIYIVILPIRLKAALASTAMLIITITLRPINTKWMVLNNLQM
jgi:hypothetical protein